MQVYVVFLQLTFIHYAIKLHYGSFWFAIADQPHDLHTILLKSQRDDIMIINAEKGNKK